MSQKRAARLGLQTEAHRQRPLTGAAARMAEASGRTHPYSYEERMAVLTLAYEVGPTEASRQTGVSKYLIKDWLDKHRRDMRAAMALMQEKGWWDL